MGTTETQLNRALWNDPKFAGVFAADRLPPIRSLPRGAFLIANYDNSGGPGNHWIAFGNLNWPGHNPLYFDSFGTKPGDLNNSLGSNAPFARYMAVAERINDRRGYINRLDLQCVMPEHNRGVHADVCGEYAVMFCRIKKLPVDPRTGHIDKRWAPVFSWRSNCEKAEHLVKKIAGIRQA